MREQSTLELTQDLFQFVTQIPRTKLIRGSFEGIPRRENELLVLLLMNLGDDKKAISVTEISNMLQITPAGVTHLLNPLEETGYIIRLQAPNDRRIVLIGLTDKGTELAEALLLNVQETLSGLVNYLGEEDCRTFIRLLSRVIEFLNSQPGN